MSEAPSRLILVVDDDEAIRDQLAWQLEAEGYDVHTACDGAAALAFVAVTRPDLVVLDLTIPLVPGLEVLQALRSSPAAQAVPVIILSGRSSEGDRILGLDSGADDYLIKPFSPGELVARVRSLLRRSVPAASAPAISERLVVDSAAREVWVDGAPVTLTAKEFDLLAFLMSHPRQVFTRAQLLHEVWDNDGWQSEATVTEHVHRLRGKVEADPTHPRMLRTVRGVGYRLEP